MADTTGLDLARVIQFSVAPIVLVSGVGLILLVLTNRLGRIVDRARVVQRALADRRAAPGAATPDAHRPEAESAPASGDEPAPAEAAAELRVLGRRSRLILVAIACSVGCVLGVALLIIVLFLGSLAGHVLAGFASALFAAAVAAMTVGMVAFLAEILLTVRTLRLDAEVR